MTGCGRQGRHCHRLRFDPGHHRGRPADSGASLGVGRNSNPGGVLIPLQIGAMVSTQALSAGQQTGRSSAADSTAMLESITRMSPAIIWRSSGSSGALVASHLSPLNPTLVNGVPLPMLGGSMRGTGWRSRRGSACVSSFSKPTTTSRPNVAPAKSAGCSPFFTRMSCPTRVSIENRRGRHAQQFARSLDLAQEEISSRGGRIENVAGDSVLILFNNAYAAVMSAINWQRRLTP